MKRLVLALATCAMSASGAIAQDKPNILVLWGG